MADDTKNSKNDLKNTVGMGIESLFKTMVNDPNGKFWKWDCRGESGYCVELPGVGELIISDSYKESELEVKVPAADFPEIVKQCEQMQKQIEEKRTKEEAERQRQICEKYAEIARNYLESKMEGLFTLQKGTKSVVQLCADILSAPDKVDIKSSEYGEEWYSPVEVWLKSDKRRLFTIGCWGANDFFLDILCNASYRDRRVRFGRICYVDLVPNIGGRTVFNSKDPGFENIKDVYKIYLQRRCMQDCCAYGKLNQPDYSKLIKVDKDKTVFRCHSRWIYENGHGRGGRCWFWGNDDCPLYQKVQERLQR